MPNIRETYALSDLLLVPKYSIITSRSQIDVSVKLGSLTFAHPIITANMTSVSGREMCVEVIRNSGLAILHRFMDEKEQLQIATDIINQYGSNHFAVSVGIKDSDKDLLNRFYFAGVRIVCIDIAHADSKHCVETVSWIKEHNPDMFVIAGNISTGRGAQRLWEAGADVVKCGQGSGSLCSTRIETGNGVPQLSALMDIAETRRTLKNDFHYAQRTLGIIADGGIVAAGDVVKSLCFADMVMMGQAFSGCVESPGRRVMIAGIEHKEYVGSSTHKDKHIEGVKALVATTGSYQSVLGKLLEGLRSGMSYQNCLNLIELKEDPEFIKVSHAGLVESLPHVKGSIQ